jgi:putative hydrolase of the HAD superfamily
VVIKAVVFDYGQVISLPQDPGTIDDLAGMAGVEKEKFENLLWPLRHDYDRGIISAREYYGNIISRLGISLDEKTLNEMIETDHASWKNINKGTVKLMEDIKKAGYALGILSNMPHDFLAWARKNLAVFSLPHVSLFSCEAKLVKPEEAIYRKLLALLGIESGELVFFDDNAENIRGAAALGIRAFLWEDPEAARRELQILGVFSPG